jgi:uroporphyrinogen decarboxylase
VALYLNAQIDAGAQAVMVFDSWGGVLADGAFQEFSLAYTTRVLAQLKNEHDGVRIPRIVFTKGGGLWLDEMKDLDCDVLGLDWTVNLGKARALVVAAQGLAGQYRPERVVCQPRTQIEAEVAKVLDSF